MRSLPRPLLLEERLGLDLAVEAFPCLSLQMICYLLHPWALGSGPSTTSGYRCHRQKDS